MNLKNICSKRDYDKDGVKKTKWFTVGVLKTNDDGKQFIELNMFPNTPLYVFEQKKKEEPSEYEG